MKKIFIIWIITLATIEGQSQSSLYISSGANLFISSGAMVYIDGIILKPSADYNIIGLNSFTRNTVATPPPPTTYIRRVYHLLSTLPLFSGDITIYYQDAELNSLDENTMNLNVYDGSMWNVFTPTVRDATGNFVTAAGLTNIAINQATLAAPASSLPIILSHFTVDVNNCIAKLKWTTTSERNSKYFEIQQSTDGVNFTTIAQVPSSGNTTTEKQYSYNGSLLNSNNYFRLNMVDIDGQKKFSGVVSATSNCSLNIISVFPNPARNQLTVTGLSGTNELKLLNAEGQFVTKIKTTGNQEKLNLINLSSGNYILQIIKNNKVIDNIKVVKE